MIDVRIVSDVVLWPVEQQLKQNLAISTIHIEYEEELITWALKTNLPADFEGLLFIHSDQYFHRKPLEWQLQFASAVLNLVSNTSCKILLSNSLGISFTKRPLKHSSGDYHGISDSLGEVIQKCLGFSNFFLFDFHSLVLSEGLMDAYNYNLGHLYQMPYTKSMVIRLGRLINDSIHFHASEEKKVIVLDCDNTLWGGIVGEDGTASIQCDRNAAGILYYHFQEFLSGLKATGFILCLCSKNNEADVVDAFSKRNFPLSWDDFVIKKVNWEEKWKNIQEISMELNVGIDSMIFIDDNPFELNVVKSILKGITTFEFTASYDDFLNLTAQQVFRKKVVLEADKKKTEQYQTEQQRKEWEHASSDFRNYLDGLKIKLEIFRNDRSDFLRLAQMTEKTNQFNFWKEEFTKEALNKWVDAGNLVFSLKLSDKFGDYGTVGLLLIDQVDQSWRLYNYLMSCRALGKDVETQFLKKVVETLASENIKLSDYRFKISDKNTPAQEFIKTMKLWN